MAAYTTIDNPELYFQAVLYTGNGSTQSITLPGSEDMQPDLVWIKQRNDDGGQVIFDVLRGVHNYQLLNYTGAEVTGTTDNLTAFNSDGFSLGADAGLGYVNANTDTYVAYTWKAGTTGTDLTAGDIDPSSSSINTTSKFGIYILTGTGSAGTVAHGLGAVPSFIFQKDRAGPAEGWVTQHVTFGATHYFNLDHTRQATDSSSRWNDVNPTSSVYSIGTNNSSDTKVYMMYAFAPVQGFSSFNSYEGNGNIDGPFIFTGFKPALVWIKNADNADNYPRAVASSWALFDNKRNPFNPANTFFFSDSDVSGTTSDPEATGKDIDFLSNGFKVRGGASIQTNTSGNTHIYMAWAEAPFVNSNGVPCNAR